MVKTLDWVAKAQTDDKLKTKIFKLLESDSSNDIEIDGIYRLRFCAGEKILTIR